jgi:Domain of unknown function (DUF4872)/Butirosin biosynthesis protein H, N-terminal
LLQTFDHVHSAHCESGAFAALLRHEGVKLSESMVFGIGSGLFFLFLPFVKIYGAPLVAYRDMPNAIIARGTRRLGVKIARYRFSDPDRGMSMLDETLARARPVGLQTGVFWLPYFPRDMRFQFNGHHVIAYGKEAEDYLLSDTVFEDVVRCPSDDLRRARFAKGPLAPRGLLYYIESVTREPDLVRAVRAGLNSTASRMLRVPVPYLGIRGIRTLARAIRRWPQRLPAKTAKHWLANVIRMQEEIGTGGGGFRFMYAAFLDEAGDLLEKPVLHQASSAMTEVGDRWREFAVQSAQILRNSEHSVGAYGAVADIVMDCAAREERVFRLVREALRS